MLVSFEKFFIKNNLELRVNEFPSTMRVKLAAQTLSAVSYSDEIFEIIGNLIRLDVSLANFIETNRLAS